MVNASINLYISVIHKAIYFGLFVHKRAPFIIDDSMSKHQISFDKVHFDYSIYECLCHVVWAVNDIKHRIKHKFTYMKLLPSCARK